MQANQWDDHKWSCYDIQYKQNFLTVCDLTLTFALTAVNSPSDKMFQWCLAGVSLLVITHWLFSHFFFFFAFLFCLVNAASKQSMGLMGVGLLILNSCTWGHWWELMISLQDWYTDAQKHSSFLIFNKPRLLPLWSCCETQVNSFFLKKIVWRPLSEHVVQMSLSNWYEHHQVKFAVFAVGPFDIIALS